MASCTTVLGDFEVVPGGINLVNPDGSVGTGDGSSGNVAERPKDITKFTINGVDGAITGNNIALTLPFGTDVTKLTPTIVHTGVSVSPASGAQQDFTNAVSYTVAANDGTQKAYMVRVSVAGSGAKDITQFTIDGTDATITGTTIIITLPADAVLTALTPTIKITGASISPSNNTAHDFTNPVTYTVTAADGTTKAYQVTVQKASPNSKDITDFSINGVKGVISGQSIALTLPAGTAVAALQPKVTITGVSVAPADGAAQDFTSPVEYLVTAQDASTKTYQVTVTVAASDAKDITAFSINGVEGSIAGRDISLTLPAGSDLTSLIPKIVITGTSVTPANEVAQNFTQPVTYTVAAADGSRKDYVVTVGVAAGTAKDITSFVILGSAGTIQGTNISLTLPAGTNVTSLIPTIIITGASVSPASGAAQNFSAPVTYTVKAADSSTKDYVVTVTVAASTSKDITSFSILSVPGAIQGTNITLTVPSGTPVTNLTPTIAITGVSVSPASGTPRNFTSPQTYTVTAGDSSTKSYTVTVNVAASNTKDITAFSILGVPGSIVGQNITLTVPSGSDITNASPTISHNGASISPASGVPRNFTTPQTYTVTAADASTKVYTVTVNVAASTTNDITAFAITGVNGTFNGSDIALTLPSGTNVTSLTPTITINGTSVSPASGVAQNFTNPVDYTVTAASGDTKVYTVTVTVAASTTKEITQFTINGVNGTINGNQIALTLPAGTSLSSLTPTIAITGVSVSPASGVAQNFTNPVNYTVQAADGSQAVYTVTVTVAASTTKDITAFTISGTPGVIAGQAITLNMPYGTNVNSLTPTVTINGVSVSPASGVTQNFTNPVQYTVTAGDGSTKVYTVTVNVATEPTVNCTLQQVIHRDADWVTCTTVAALPSPGGAVTTGLYNLTKWGISSGFCSGASTYHRGSMSITKSGTEYFMRYTIAASATQSGGTEVSNVWWLKFGKTIGTVTRQAMCGHSTTVQTGTYKTGAVGTFAAISFVTNSSANQDSWVEVDPRGF